MRMRGAAAVLALTWIAVLAAPAAAQDTSSPAEDAAKKEVDTAAAEAAGVELPPGSKASVVRVGGLINDIQQLDLQSHSYTADMYMWFKWTNPDTGRAGWRARTPSGRLTTR